MRSERASYCEENKKMPERLLEWERWEAPLERRELETHRGWQAAEKQHGEKACSLFTGVH